MVRIFMAHDRLLLEAREGKMPADVEDSADQPASNALHRRARSFDPEPSPPNRLRMAEMAKVPLGDGLAVLPIVRSGPKAHALQLCSRQPVVATRREVPDRIGAVLEERTVREAVQRA